MVTRRKLLLLGIVASAAIAGLLNGLADGSYWWLGFAPALFILMFGPLFLTAVEHTIDVRRAEQRAEIRARKSKRKGFVDEDLTIPPDAMKDYSIPMLKGDHIDLRAFSYSDSMLTAEVIDPQEATKPKPRIEKRSFESKVVMFGFKPRYDAEWIVRLRNLGDSPATASVIIRLFARRD